MQPISFLNSVFSDYVVFYGDIILILSTTLMLQIGLHCVPQKVSPLNILQQPPQTCTDLNEILHTQDDIYFCHRRQIS